MLKWSLRPHAVLGAGEERQAGNEAAPLRRFHTAPKVLSQPDGPKPHLTGFLGILDLHGVCGRNQAKLRVRTTQGSGCDSGGAWAAREGPAGSSPQAGRGGPRAGRRRLRRGPAQGAASPPPRGCAGTERAGEGRRPRRSGAAPRSRSKQKAPVPRADAAAAAAALRNSPPRPRAHVTRAPPLSARRRLLGIVVLRVLTPRSLAAAILSFLAGTGTDGIGDLLLASLPPLHICPPVYWMRVMISDRIWLQRVFSI
uniref:uncharacterized protein LOC118544800 n=1 Tax=Halichoerus grypus TaxID=9711 RepID=UPI001659789B|nr:uncharacterized protein LOC118544800 [Halichoerus grypus]XP_035962640.1 uncharacterized protein LOC118544800 [Halichoerus grypus]XP_035962641.1 uncharacterized protein LOC118544800 [Halichoerus grypus]